MSDQTVISARMPFIRRAHTEVADGQCGLCDVTWPCDAGMALMALAATEARVSELTAALEAVHTQLDKLARLEQFMAHINRVIELGGTITLRPKQLDALVALAAAAGAESSNAST